MQTYHIKKIEGKKGKDRAISPSKYVIQGAEINYSTNNYRIT